MFQPFVEGLIAEGAIAATVSPTIITTNLQRIFESTFRYWTALDLDERVFRSQLRAGFALTFLGLFDGADHEALLAELQTLEPPSVTA
jgi:hypothetical protein